MIPDDDRGLLLGDGVFETVLADAGRLVCFSAHMARMARGAAALGLPEPDRVAAEHAARQALDAADLGTMRAAVRLTWTAGSGGRGLDRPEPAAPRLLVRCAPAPRQDGAIRLALSSVRRNEGSPTSRHKTLAYLDNVLARREARAAGADEAVMLNNRGELACAAAANVFWLKGETLFTPALSCGVLGGVVRAQVLELAPMLGLAASVVAQGGGALDDADAVFVTNSLVGVRLAVGASAEGAAVVGVIAAEVERVRCGR